MKNTHNTHTTPTTPTPTTFDTTYKYAIINNVKYQILNATTVRVDGTLDDDVHIYQFNFENIPSITYTNN